MSRFIRLRGLPWSVTNQEIIDFLKNANVVNGPNGIHLVTNRWDGKNTGEAFVELEGPEDEEEAFKHNKETLGHRYIEIFSATRDEAEMSAKKTGSTSNVVKLRGLPYAITEENIEDFFNGLEIRPDREGILIVMDRRGRASGEAYVQFETPEDTEQALKRNREKIGHRYIEIFRSSIAEMRRQSGSRPGPYDKKDRGGPRVGNNGRNDLGGGRNLRGGSGGPRELWSNNYGGGNGSGNFGNSGGFGGNNNSGGNGGFNGGGRFNNNNGSGFGNNSGGGFGDFNNFGNNRNNFGSGGGGGGGNNFDNFNNRGGGGGSNSSGSFSGNNFNSFNNDNARSSGNNSGGFGPVGGGRNDDLFCVHMRGLPYSCFESEVTKFFEPLRPASIKIIYNNKGLHSGSADAYFESNDDAVLAMKKHREQMGNRYIELFFDGKTNNRGGNNNSNSNNSFSRRI